MTLFVDTSVWSLAFRRDRPPARPEVGALRSALESGRVVTTGLVLQELLQGIRGPKARLGLVRRFSALPVLVPELEDHVEAAALRNACRRKGLPVGTIDALLARLCIRYDLPLLTTDRDFEGIARHSGLTLWSA